MSKRYKCALGCKEKQRLFRFPEDETRRLLWFKATKLEYSFQKNLCLCAKHFSGKFLINKRITNNAIPDKCLVLASDTTKIACGEASVIDDDTGCNEFDTKTKNSDPLWETTKRKKYKSMRTPMATLEMKLTTEEWQKVDKLPKLPTGKEEPVIASAVKEHEKPIAEVLNNAALSVEPTVQLPIALKLPKGITIKKAPITKTVDDNKTNTSTGQCDSVTDWQNQAKQLRAKVEEKLKNFVDPTSAHVNDEMYSKPTKDISDEFPPNDDAFSESISENFAQSTAPEKTLATEQSKASSKEMQDFGFVQHCSIDNSFHLTCFWCASVFKLSNWQAYVEHFTKVHNFENNLNTSKTHTQLNDDIDSLKQYSAASLTNGSTFENCYLESSSSNFDVYYDETMMDVNDISTLNSPSKNKPPNTAILNFKTTDSAKILKFLETLQSNAFLWHTRRLNPTKWDQQAQKFLLEFDPQMSLDDFRSSMYAVHSFYRRLMPLTAEKRLKLKKNILFEQYLKKLEEIEKLSESYAYHCDHCPFYHLDEDRFETHKYTKHGIGDMPFACSCGLHFDSANKKAAHEKLHKMEAKYMCELCGMALYSRIKLLNHRISQHPDTVENPYPYQCTECDAKFSFKFLLSSHQVLKHQPPRFKCEICGKTFKESFSYKSHLKMHLNQRDYICEDCGKGFVNKKHLRHHQIVMHQTVQYRCKPCYTHFATQAQLNRHNEKYHPDGGNFDRVRAHRRKVSRQKAEESGKLAAGRKKRELKCKQCGSHFERMRDFLRHKRELGHRLGERRYKCPYCESVLSSDLTFLRHLCNMHKMSVKAADLKNYTPLHEECFENEKVEVEKAPLEILENIEIIDQNMLVDDNTMFEEMFEECLSENEFEAEL